MLQNLAQISEATLNWEEIKEYVQADINDQIEEILIDEDIIQGFVKQKL